MRADKLADAIGEVRDDFVLDAGVSHGIGRRVRVSLAAAAACAAVAVGVLGLSGAMRGPGDYDTQELAFDGAAGERVRVFRLTGVPEGAGAGSEACLVPCTEEEIFSRENTAIFRGTVTEIENIEADMDGESFYWSVVTVLVSETLRGDYAPGESVRIRADCCIDSETLATGQGVTERIRVGTEGIFMPVVYDGENSLFGANGVWLDLMCVADCGFWDGVRWAFLETDEGLVFDRDTYTGLTEAGTLDDAEEYIRDRIGEAGT